MSPDVVKSWINLIPLIQDNLFSIILLSLLAWLWQNRKLVSKAMMDTLGQTDAEQQQQINQMRYDIDALMAKSSKKSKKPQTATVSASEDTDTTL